jgi:hypothetical protein
VRRCGSDFRPQTQTAGRRASTSTSTTHHGQRQHHGQGHETTDNANSVTRREGLLVSNSAQLPYLLFTNEGLRPRTKEALCVSSWRMAWPRTRPGGACQGAELRLTAADGGGGGESRTAIGQLRIGTGAPQVVGPAGCGCACCEGRGGHFREGARARTSCCCCELEGGMDDPAGGA